MRICCIYIYVILILTITRIIYSYIYTYNHLYTLRKIYIYTLLEMIPQLLLKKLIKTLGL